MKFATTLGVVLLSTVATAGEPAFLQAIEPRAFVFPQDHASHPGYQTEWWYATGTLRDGAGRLFGYQFTIFRRALEAQTAVERGRKSAWALSDVYLGHAAISDIEGKRFYCTELYRRGGLNVAGATTVDEARAGRPIRVYLDAWELLKTGEGWSLKFRFDTVELDLALKDTRAPILNGRESEAGLSRKGPNPGQASYYYSSIGLESTGTLKIAGDTFAIRSGRSWLDREWGSNSLSEKQAGWDWFAIQLDGGAALMLYFLRNSDGSLEPASSGTFVDATGAVTHVPLDEIKFTRGREWTSPHSKGRYTLGWTLELPKQQLALQINTAQDDQEMRSKLSGIYYYEGAIRAKGTLRGQPVQGEGYLEITGPPGQEKSKGGRGLGGIL